MPGERGSEAGVGWGVGGWSPPLGTSWQTARPPGPGRALQENGGNGPDWEQANGESPA